MLQKKNIVLASAVLAASFCMGNIFAADTNAVQALGNSNTPFASWDGTMDPSQIRVNDYWTKQNRLRYIEALKKASYVGLIFDTKTNATAYARALVGLESFSVRSLDGVYTLTQVGTKTVRSVTDDSFSFLCKFKASPFFSTSEDASAFAKIVNLGDHRVIKLQNTAYTLSNAVGARYVFAETGFLPAVKTRTE